jgi:hypothetical protein
MPHIPQEAVGIIAILIGLVKPRPRSPRASAQAIPPPPASTAACSRSRSSRPGNGNQISGGFRAAPEFWEFFRAAGASSTASSSTT